MNSKSKNSQNVLGFINKYIDARLGQEFKKTNQDKFRRGELNVFAQKNKKCPFCQLFYNQIYFAAHINLCMKLDFNSRFELYIQAKTRYTSLTEEDIAQITEPQTIKVDTSLYRIDCECKNGNGREFKGKTVLADDHARSHRNEFPFHCYHCKKHNSNGGHLLHSHFSSCVPYKMYLQQTYKQ